MSTFNLANSAENRQSLRLSDASSGVGARAADPEGTPVMPRYLFHLSDGKDTFIDDTDKDLGDSPAAHAPGLRIVEKIRRLIPDADKSTRQSMLTVTSPGD
jgi:hypothetical protein